MPQKRNGNVHLTGFDNQPELKGKGFLFVIARQGAQLQTGLQGKL